MSFFDDARAGLSTLASPAASANQAMEVLYGTYFGLHVLDAHSTARAIRKGGTEANFFLASVMDGGKHPIAAMVAVKVVAATATVGCAEIVRRRNPSAALALMSVIDAVYAGTVLHNYSLPLPGP